MCILKVFNIQWFLKLKGLTLSYEEKCACNRDKFCAFLIDEERFTVEQKTYLQKAIVNDKISGILYVAAVLAGWSFIAAWIDALLIPGATLVSIFNAKVSLNAFIVPAAFFVLNTLLKFVYISLSLRGKLPIFKLLIASLPYVGSIYLLREYLSKDRLMTTATKYFLQEQKNIIKRKIRNALT